ncbi:MULTISPECIES: fructoselysine 3-epimerase [unclassified Halanaerobium]|uniref:fructoselysine 3-epimerase n=1 Tax=unclassified Halanaerobium TaxID=2641197 RepID=UPI000DF416B0|nr:MULTISPECIES: fructoselysine 3-epimerase [unclassified Halanaerobium]RCW41549.1 protein FrlC [Halanaerobium sp. MA284_MarDTE_T2]RCW81123.1 protein FrlC [Halanaerobium sp. DL-01]
MKIGMFTSGYIRKRLEDAFRDAKRFGYDGIELWGGRPHAYAPDLKNGKIKEIKDLIDKYEIPVFGYTPELNAYPFNMMTIDNKIRKESLDYIKLSMDMAKKMGADFTLISAGHAGYYLSKKEIWDLLLTNLKVIKNYAETIKHKIVIEPLTMYESNVIRETNDLKAIFKEIESEYIFGMCDVVPPFVHQEPLTNYLEKLKDKLYHIHLVDNNGCSDIHLIPGEGNIPLKEYLEELDYYNYKGYLTIELVSSYINDPSLYSKKAIKNLKKLLKN